jgi:hypothetical protein
MGSALSMISMVGIAAIIAIITYISVVYNESLRCGKEVENGFYQQQNLSENN